ncbi:DUF4136 domain-containing protein [Flavobacterium sp.]|uniref:DUF4136 domain-containing protein n=1 Tax=Flavobacterium sp. TaxID=239 RepID=UPI001B5A85DB|nr:DUF4136 domain-containing protein [Flavobacterium sp.]MBP6126881.1 DUF4136 domain-containing protein [Flavobacterium sp.]
MKLIKLLPVLGFLILTSCSSVYVNTDYDKKANFAAYKTYAYNKSSIDKLEISDLDKKRILYAIDAVMPTKQFSKSENPDVLINIFTKERERVDVYNNMGWGYGFGWGWGPNWGMGYSRTTTTPEGTLYIDIVDAKTKELVWQGIGTGYLTTNTEKKDERIAEFVAKILEKYPPVIK